MLKLVFRIALITLLTLGVIKTNRFFLTKSAFEINSVKVVGASEKLEESFVPLKEQLIGKNINDIDFEKVRKKILEDVRIKNADVKKEALNKIIIEVEEREPKYYLQYKKNMYLLDKEGKIYGYLNDLKTKDFICIVTQKEEDIELLIEILGKIEATDFKDVVSQIFVEDNKCVNVVLVNGAILKTNREVKKEKYDISSYLFFNLSAKKRIDYMDLRFEDYIVKYMEDKNGR